MTAAKDDLQAHRFMNRRVCAALLDGDADADARPLSRLRTGTYVGIAVTIALLAVAGIFGVLRPGGSTAWQESGAFIIERETGARYVYLDDMLHPVLNYSSARLLLGGQLHVTSVASRSLEGAPHGPPIGIPAAPDSLPDASHMAGSTWSVCAVGNASDGAPFRTTIFPGRLADGDGVPDGTAYLLRTTGGRTFLVAQDHAFAIADRWLAALGFRDAPRIEVASDFVDSLPPGEPIAPMPVPGLGEQGPPLPGSSAPITIGTVFVDRVDAKYVMTRSGLTALTPLQADLLLADPDFASAYSGGIPTAVPIGQAQVTEAALPPQAGPRRGEQAPATAPNPVALPTGDQQLCVRYPADGPPDIVVTESDPSPLSAGTVQLSTGGGALVTVRSDIGAPTAGGQQATRTTSAKAGASGNAAIPGATESVGCDSTMGSPGAAGITAVGGANTPDAAAKTPSASPTIPPVNTTIPDARVTGADAIPLVPPATTPAAGGSVPIDRAGNPTTDPGPMICLVTDAGQRYPLAGRALRQLGLSGVSVAQLPAAVIGLLPIGPVLDPDAAAAVAP